MQAAINLYQDNVLVRISEQTKLTSDDLTFLTLYMTGLSAKTICVILDIKQSTYYSHRRRIREKIKCSEAPDATEFLALLGIMD
ncbi:MAG: LuxR C-terminal-related transcriptional regulator [Muribaculaceae bacterium]|nr:LuxR C-terminal-related transcriptional regulator [Muribaculaceae bacterium]